MARRDYNEELESAFKNGRVQHAIEQEGYAYVTPEESYLYKEKGSSFFSDAVRTAFQYGLICSDELGIHQESGFFNDMQKRNRAILVHFLAKAVYKFGAQNVGLLPHYEEGGELEKDVRFSISEFESYHSLRNGRGFKNFIKEICCWIE